MAFPSLYTVGPRSNAVTRLPPFTLTGDGLVVALSPLHTGPRGPPCKTRFAVGGYPFGGRNFTGWHLPASLGARSVGAAAATAVRVGILP